MPEIDLLEVLRTSFTLVILLFCSIIALTFVVERWWYFRSIRIHTDGFMADLKRLLQENKYADADRLCSNTKGPVAAVMQVAISNMTKPKKEVMALLSAAQIDERGKMERFIGILGTMGNIAPFIGLFGTVVGIIRAFHDLAVAGSGGPSVVAAGISEALVATAGGLAVAIPAVVFFNYFTKRVKDLSDAMESSAIKILVYMGMA